MPAAAGRFERAIGSFASCGPRWLGWCRNKRWAFALVDLPCGAVLVAEVPAAVVAAAWAVAEFRMALLGLQPFVVLLRFLAHDLRTPFGYSISAPSISTPAFSAFLTSASRTDTSTVICASVSGHSVSTICCHNSAGIFAAAVLYSIGTSSGSSTLQRSDVESARVLNCPSSLRGPFFGAGNASSTRTQ